LQEKRFMKTAYIFLSLLLSASLGFSQVSMLTNLPPSMAPNTQFNIEVKITKGNINTFSKYQMDVPAGVIVTEGNSQTGNFTFDAGRAKIVWVSVPPPPEFIVSFKVNTGTASGPAVINQKFFYVEEGSKKEIEAEPLNITFESSGATVAKSFNAGATAEGSMASASPGDNNNSNTSNTSNPAATNSDPAATPTESVTTSTSTNTSPEPVATTNSITDSPPVTSVTTPESSSSSSSNPPAETKTPVTETKAPVTEAKAPVADKTPEKPAVTSSGLVYKVQLGAYGYDPGKTKFNSAGKVSISKEDGFYKVILGSFNSKEEAVQKVQELKVKGFDSFVVKYQNGIRVK
jgi:cell division protein FtsN